MSSLIAFGSEERGPFEVLIEPDLVLGANREYLRGD